MRRGCARPLAMITAVVLASNDSDALARTLCALVPGVAEGLIADAVVVTREPQKGVAAVADALGATVLVTSGDPWFGASGIARQNWLLCLNGGDVPSGSWIEVIGRLVWDSTDVRLAFLSRRQNPVARRLASLRASTLGVTQVRAGDLVRRSILVEGRISARTRPVRLAAAIERPRR